MRRSPGFTLLEILVVVGIILLLIGVVVPATIISRKRSHEAVCISNLRQIGQALSLYEQDYGGPPDRLSRIGEGAYRGSAGILRCPADPTGNLGYLMQGNLNLPRQAPSAVGVSYLYLMHYATLPEIQDCFATLPSTVGMVVCVSHGTYHGESIVSAGVDPYPNYQGRVLRLRKDGSVVTRNLPVDDTWQAYRLFLWEPGMSADVKIPGCVDAGAGDNANQ